MAERSGTTTLPVDHVAHPLAVDLHEAILIGLTDQVRALLHAPAMQAALDDPGFVAGVLQRCVRANHLRDGTRAALLEVVIAHPLCTTTAINTFDDQGKSLLYWAGWLELLTVTQTLLHAGASFDAQDPTSDAAAHPLPAVVFDNGVLNVMVNAGMDLEVVSSEGKTGLILKAASHEAQQVQGMIQAGANVHAKTVGGEQSGRTALFYACARANNGAMVQALLDAGADPWVTDDAGRTVYDWLRTLPHRPESEAMLRRWEIQRLHDASVQINAHTVSRVRL